MYCDGYGEGFRGMHFFGGGSMIMGLIFIIALIFLIVELVKYFKKDTPTQNIYSPNSPNKALKILEEEYALGKIDRVEFEERREVLRDR